MFAIVIEKQSQNGILCPRVEVEQRTNSKMRNEMKNFPIFSDRSSIKLIHINVYENNARSRLFCRIAKKIYCL